MILFELLQNIWDSISQHDLIFLIIGFIFTAIGAVLAISSFMYNKKHQDPLVKRLNVFLSKVEVYEHRHLNAIQHNFNVAYSLLKTFLMSIDQQIKQNPRVKLSLCLSPKNIPTSKITEITSENLIKINEFPVDYKILTNVNKIISQLCLINRYMDSMIKNDTYNDDLSMIINEFNEFENLTNKLKNDIDNLKFI